MKPHKSSVVLTMRYGLDIRHDHVDTLHRIGVAVHLLTEEEGAREDPRYTSVHILPPGTTTERVEEETVALLKDTDSSFALTFQETDIVAVGRANARHGVSWSRPEADEVARDKSRQRAALEQAGVPSPRYRRAGAREVGQEDLDHVGLPCVVKPTRGASSSHVQLVNTREEAVAVIEAIRRLASSGAHHFYDFLPREWAMLEEYLPGEEVTCDGVVIDGVFHLGGIHSKVLPDTPWFEEDLYTLPYGDEGVEQEITEMMQDLVSSLGLKMCLFNTELRRDTRGHFRVVEFSTRISGGHVYRNIRSVHGVDLVELFVRAALGEAGIDERARERHPGLQATCIRFIYRSGVVRTNTPGPGREHPAFQEYYPLAMRGSEVRSAPEGFDICGLLSVAVPYVAERHPREVHAAARAVEGKLDLVVTPFPKEG